MRISFTALLLLLFSAIGFSQQEKTPEKGAVSYISSQNVYVKFKSTDGIEVGDTLYQQAGEELSPLLEVASKSSTSCVCKPLGPHELKLSDEMVALVSRKKEEKKEEKKERPGLTQPDEQRDVVTVMEDEPAAGLDEPVGFSQKIRGRFSAGSYSTLSDHGEQHRMRYAVNFSGSNLGGSRFSVDSYVAFRHTLGEWDRVQENLGHALKVYSLALKYDFDKSTSLTVGRRINRRISSMGAIDGFQFEKGFGKFYLGAIVGSRPDYSDYGVDPSLLQAGAYLSFVSDPAKRMQQSTLAFVEQRNSGAVDRRFAYFQHSSTLAKNLSLFGSFEVDAYEKINNETNTSPRLTNLFVSLRYRFSRKISVSTSYDSRNNIIYYESYKNNLDRLIDQETRNGLRLGLNIRPWKTVTWGLNGSWRFQKSDMNVSKNLNTYLNFSRVPKIKVRASLTANFLQTNYLSSRSYGLRLSRDIIKGKLVGDLYFRMVDYRYTSLEYTTHQKIAGANLNLRLSKKLTLFLYGEQTFDDRGNNLTRVNSKIVQRF